MQARRRDRLFRAATAVHRALYRISGGRVGGRLAGCPVLLLTTTGRRTGRPHTAPLLYQPDGDRLVVVASKGGDPRHPAWYRNLTADPDVVVDVGRRRIPMRAGTAEGDERTRLWALVTGAYPPYDDYQAKTRRRIPVVVLTPR